MFAFREAHRQRDAKVAADLRDDQGERIISARRGGRVAITESDLRTDLATDLDALLNTVNLASGFDLTEFKDVRESILNYGIPAISDRTIDEARVDDIAREIRQALIQFEPRLVPEALVVRRDTTVDRYSLNVRFLVSGEMIADPADVAVEFVADVELGTGKMRLGAR
jgi:type VI secretion system protein ImpF